MLKPLQRALCKGPLDVGIAMLRVATMEIKCTNSVSGAICQQFHDCRQRHLVNNMTVQSDQDIILDKLVFRQRRGSGVG